MNPSGRYNKNSSRNAVKIPLGNSKYVTGTKTYFLERMGYGVHVVAAITRYGKSVLVRNLYTEVGQKRPVVVLDYLGEHSTSRWPNFLSDSRNTKCLPNMIEIKDFKFKISQFNRESDWLSLGFAERGSLLMKHLAVQRNAHRDDPEIFDEMLSDVPVGHDSVAGFENRWGFILPTYNKQVVDSCKALFGYLLSQEFFAKQDDTLYNFGNLSLTNAHLNINFNLDKADVGKARAMAGKVLEQLEVVFDRYDIPPLIVIEEADVLAPAIPDGPYIMSSLALLIKFVLKLQKKGIELMFIIQDPNNLHPSIFGNKHTFIYGQLPGGNSYPASRNLRWNAEENYREFNIERTGQPGYETFIPDDSCTLY